MKVMSISSLVFMLARSHLSPSAQRNSHTWPHAAKSENFSKSQDICIGRVHQPHNDRCIPKSYALYCRNVIPSQSSLSSPRSVLFSDSQSHSPGSRNHLMRTRYAEPPSIVESRQKKKREAKTKIRSDENQKGVSVKAQKNL